MGETGPQLTRPAKMPWENHVPYPADLEPSEAQVAAGSLPRSSQLPGFACFMLHSISRNQEWAAAGRRGHGGCWLNPGAVKLFPVRGHSGQGLLGRALACGTDCQDPDLRHAGGLREGATCSDLLLKDLPCLGLRFLIAEEEAQEMTRTSVPLMRPGYATWRGPATHGPA